MTAIEIINEQLSGTDFSEFTAVTMIKRFCAEMEGNELTLALHAIMQKSRDYYEAVGVRRAARRIENEFSEIIDRVHDTAGTPKATTSDAKYAIDATCRNCGGQITGTTHTCPEL